MNKNITALIIVIAVLFSAAFQCGKDESEKSSDGKTTSSGGLTEEIVKRKIKESVETQVLGVTGPKSVDVEFKSIKFGKSETPSKQDEIDGIRSDVYYPVRVKYTVIRHWADSDKEEERYEDWKFYIDSFGEWSYVWERAG